VLANWDLRRARPLELAAWQYALPGPWAQADNPTGADTTAGIRDALEAGDREAARALAEARLRALIGLHERLAASYLGGAA
jgi:DNA-binding GntR family transcriptional regulator